MGYLIDRDISIESQVIVIAICMILLTGLMTFRGSKSV
jgi:hypothetical protein